MYSMLNLSWGKRIAMLYIGFVVLIAFMITMSMRQNIELVSADYYDRELVFQNKIDEMNNANALSEKVEYHITDNDFVIQFPSQFKDVKLNGEVLFFRPSDESKDFTTTLFLNQNGEHFVARKNLFKGMYKMQLSWKVNEIPYFVEETVVIP